MSIAQPINDSKSSQAHSPNLASMAQELQQFVEQAAREGLDFYGIESGVLEMVLRMGWLATDHALQLQGDGDLGESIQTEDGQTLHRSETPVDRPLRTVFGEHCFSAFVYSPGPKKKIALRPIDARLNLPKSKESYLFEEFSQYFCVEQAFAPSKKSLKTVLGQDVCVDTLERTNQRLGQQAERFLDNLPDVPPEEEGELLVATADGKGVPLIDGEADRSPVHGPKPPRPHNRRMATLACVYSVDRHHRTAEDVVAALFRDERPQDEPKERRPRPCHKRMTAHFSTVADAGTEDQRTLRGDISAWGWADEQVKKRRRPGQALIRLCDGQQSLWDASDASLTLDVEEDAGDKLSGDNFANEPLVPDSRAEAVCLHDSPANAPSNDDVGNKASSNERRKVIDILDIIHAVGYVWLAAGTFYDKKQTDAEKFARDRILRLLQGEVSGVISGMRRMATQRKLSGDALKNINKACNYFENNKHRMRYDEYLEQGLPIATGVIEGACRHLVKDRMERTGMRWTEPNAGAMLFVRAIKVTDLWDDFHQYRQSHEQERLHPHRELLANYLPQIALAA